MAVGRVLLTAAAGVVAGFAVERAVVRGRLVPPGPSHVGDLTAVEVDGTRRTVHGPGGVEVAVEVFGPDRPGTPQLVLSHGWLCTGRVWHEQIDRLADRVRIITYDQPLHGGSSPPRDGEVTLDLLGDVLATVVREVAAPGPVVLAGHSLGGMSVLNALRRHPDVADRTTGVVLVSTASSAKGRPRRLELGIRRAAQLRGVVRKLNPWLRRSSVLRAVDRLVAHPSDLTFLIARGSQGERFDPHVAAHGHEMFFASSSDALFGPLPALLGLDEDAGLAIAARRPLTLVVGTEDRLTPESLTHRMARRTGAELVVLDGVGHVALVEAPEEVAGVLARHLGVQLGPRPRRGVHGEVA